MFFFTILLLLPFVCQTLSQTTTETTITTLPPPENLLEASDVPQAEIDEALILDVGTYETISFNYINAQYQTEKTRDYGDKCFNDYTKCLISQSAPTPVCGFHADNARGYRNLNSYCDIYLDNCRRGYRYWRILDYGICKDRYWHLEDTRRNFPFLNDIIFKFLNLKQSSGKKTPYVK